MRDFELPEKISDAVVDWLDVDLGITAGTYKYRSDFNESRKRYSVVITLSDDCWSDYDKYELLNAFEADKFELGSRLTELFPDYKFSVSLEVSDKSEEMGNVFYELEEEDEEIDEDAEDDDDPVEEVDEGYEDDEDEEESEERQYQEEGLSIVEEEEIDEDEEVGDPEEDDSEGYKASEEADEDTPEDFDDFVDEEAEEYRSDWRKSSGYSLSELWGAFGGGDDE